MLELTYRQMTSQEGHHAAPHVERERDPLGMINGEGVITGTVVSAAVIAAAAGHLEEAHIVLAILGTAFIYWLAHLHARTLGDAVKHRTHPVDALKEAVAETWPILAASLVPAVILLVTQLVGVRIRTGAWIAVIASTVLLTVYSFLAGRRGGLGMGGSLLSAAIGAALGLLVVVLKASLH
jgi:positive regulator of sigma E activity